MWWFVTTALAAGEASAELSWNPAGSWLHIEAPAGEELSVDGPAQLTIAVGEDEIEWRGTGTRLGRGIALTPEPGDDLRVAGTITSCNPTSNYCHPVAVAWRGLRPDTRRGAIALVAEGEGAEPSPFKADANAAAEAAFARATTEHKPVLLDFGAVWCPPCNLLTAEVLHADPRPEALDRVVVAALDVDDTSSWAIKDRYAIGGYPTVVVARADGTELGRIVGYPGREAWLAWLETTAARTDPAVDPAKRDPAATSPEEAAKTARELAEDRRMTEVQRWIDRGADGEDLRVARFALAPTTADAEWLLAHDAPPLSWVSALADPIDPAVGAVARKAIDRALPSASGPDAADLLAYRASLLPEAERPPQLAAAAATLRSSLSGDPALDRGYYTFLAELQAEGGDLDGAVAFLDAQTARWAGDPTWDLAAARLLNDAGRFADAAARAERGMPNAWGDNLLRMSAQLATARKGLGDPAGAAAVARSALDAVPAPAADVDVRTPRYRTALETFLPAK
jgi:thiol-disulfide isomerase/thioredoxin